MEWCKRRALEYLTRTPPDVFGCITSLCSDLGKHSETREHAAIHLGSMLLLAGQLATVAAARQFIEGCN
jgi:hypothetical protein